MYANTTTPTTNSSTWNAELYQPPKSIGFAEANEFLAMLGGDADNFCFQTFADSKDKKRDQTADQDLATGHLLNLTENFKS